jgi:hypothetical protein
MGWRFVEIERWGLDAIATLVRPSISQNDNIMSCVSCLRYVLVLRDRRRVKGRNANCRQSVQKAKQQS